MADLPPEFTKLQEEDYGDAKKVTEDLLKATGKNTMWAKEEIDNLWDSTDPEVRKRFTPVDIDSDLSYGVVLDGGDNSFKFSTVGTDSFDDHFYNTDKLDINLTTAYIEVNLGGGLHRARLPGTLSPEQKDSRSAPDTNTGLNVYYYCGWRRGTNYNVKQAFRDNKWGANYPSVARGQIFRCNTGGLLTKIALKLRGTPTCEDHVYVEIRNATATSISSNVMTRVVVPVRRTAKGEWYAIPFPQAPLLTQNQYYAIVVRSPFTTYNNHVGVGGWTKYCDGDKYPPADAYTSYDNCNTWVKHGYDDGNVPYSEGQYRPRDFAFITYITPAQELATINTDYWVYWQPLRTNRIKSVTLSVTDTRPSNTTVQYYVSNDFTTWHEVSSANSWTHTFSDQTKTHLWVRAKLRTSNSANNPNIDRVIANVVCDPPTVGYLRTKFYHPNLTNPLGASVWSRLNAPFTKEPNTTATVEIIRATTKIERFNGTGSKTVFDLEEFPAEPLIHSSVVTNAAGATTNLIEGKDYTVNYATKQVTFKSAPVSGTANVRVEYYPLFMKGLTESDFPLKTDFIAESFVMGSGSTVTLKCLPVDPIRRLHIDEVSKIEDVDFTVDYFTGQVTFNTPPGSGKVVDVGYTPYLADTGLALAYRLSRTNTVNQVYIYPNYYQTRV